LARLIHTKRPHQAASRKASWVQRFKTKTFGAGVVRARPPLKKAEKIFKELGDLDCLFILFWYNMYAKEYAPKYTIKVRYISQGLL